MSDLPDKIQAWEYGGRGYWSEPEDGGVDGAAVYVRADLLDAREDEIDRLRDALAFYADAEKYVAPFTGGQGDLYFDCGSRARAALNKEANHE